MTHKVLDSDPLKNPTFLNIVISQLKKKIYKYITEKIKLEYVF